MIKAKFGDSLRSKSDVGQINEVLCKVIAHNLCVLIACIHEIGLEMPSFSPSGKSAKVVIRLRFFSDGGRTDRPANYVVCSRLFSWMVVAN